MIHWLDIDGCFPPLHHALKDPNGLLCAGGDLSSNRILEAYQKGIFPWFSRGEPILWWSPDPRMVLIPSEFKLSRSLRKTIRQQTFEIRLDSHFAEVIDACSQITRKGQKGTWITAEMKQAYIHLHELGYAHSVESWSNDQLVGGLYGLSIGKMFYGESMFARQTDASKTALAYLCRYLDHNGFGLIDCQMNTSHLSSLGGREISRQQFIQNLQRLTATHHPLGPWPTHGAAHCFDLAQVDTPSSPSPYGQNKS